MRRTHRDRQGGRKSLLVDRSCFPDASDVLIRAERRQEGVSRCRRDYVRMDLPCDGYLCYTALTPYAL